MESISPATAAILLFTNPIWVALLGRIFLGEALSFGRTRGLILGLVGVCCAIGMGPELLSGGGKAFGEVVALASSLCWACSTLINKKAGLPLKPWALSFWQMLIGSLTLLVIAYANGEQWPVDVTSVDWGWFLWLAIPASTGSFGLWFIALGKGGATRASSFLFLVPVFSVSISFAVLGSPLSLQQASGGALIAVALWLVNRKQRTEIDAVSFQPGT